MFIIDLFFSIIKNWTQSRYHLTCKCFVKYNTTQQVMEPTAGTDNSLGKEPVCQVKKKKSGFKQLHCYRIHELRKEVPR